MKISIQNLSTVFTDAQAQALLKAWQADLPAFCDAWGIAVPQLALVPKNAPPPPGAWVMALMDNADQAGALGYHDLTADHLPLGKAFLKTTVQAGDQPTVTADHEMKEMLVDPNCDRTTIFGTSKKKGFAYAYEVCDACEDDSFGYTVGGVLLSDYVLPAWFDVGFPGPYDKGGHIQKPLTLLKGGYIGVLPLKDPSAWTQLTQEKYPGQRFEFPVGSRRERRQRYHERERSKCTSTYGANNWQKVAADLAHALQLHGAATPH